MENCIFCKIIKGEIPSPRVYEDDLMIIIRDIEPVAKNHFLMIPKKHYPLLECMTEEDAANLAKCFMKLKDLKAELELEDGFRVIINQKDNAGQTVPHLHVHILSGQKLGWESHLEK